MKMIPPPTITIMKIDITIEPGSRYWMYGTYGYTSTTSSDVVGDIRCDDGSGIDDADTMPDIVAASEPETKPSVLSSISATRGSFFSSTRREKPGGIASTPLSRPSRSADT